MNLNWYNSLNKPELTPPSEIFGPVWYFIYALIFISFFILLNKKTMLDKRPAVFLFLIQLIVNFSWGPVFFFYKNIPLSFGIIMLLLILIIMVMISFYRISKLSSMLFLPYLFWVSFAAYLNYKIMVMN